MTEEYKNRNAFWAIKAAKYIIKYQSGCSTLSNGLSIFNNGDIYV